MLPEGFGYFAVPTFYVINKSGKRLDRAVGGIGANEFLEYLKNFIKE